MTIVNNNFDNIVYLLKDNLVDKCMMSGFFNTLRQSFKENWMLKAAVCVHDSSTSAFPVDKIFEIRNFYDTYFTNYCKNVGPKIVLLFDLLVGNNYEGMGDFKQKSETEVEFSGSASTLIPIYDKIVRCKSYKVECSVPRESLIPKMELSPMARFISQKGCCIKLDNSKYKIKFTKIV